MYCKTSIYDQLVPGNKIWVWHDYYVEENEKVVFGFLTNSQKNRL